MPAHHGQQVSSARLCLQIATQVRQNNADGWTDRFGDEPRKGCDVLVQALEREGVDTVFAYPGGASMEIHQALTRSASIRNILCRHEQVRCQKDHDWFLLPTLYENSVHRCICNTE